MIKKIFFLILVFIGISLSLSCNPKSPSSKGNTNLLEVEILIPQAITSAAYDTLESFLYALSDAYLVAKTSGTVQKVYVALSDQVNAGDTLAKIEDSLLVLERSLNYSNFLRSQDENNKAQVLFEKKLISETQFQEKELDYKKAEILYKIAEKRLSDSRIVAPFSGIVAEKLTQEEQPVEQGETLFRITQTFPLLSKVFLTEEQLHNLKNLNRVKVIPKFSNSGFGWGKVYQKSSVINPATGTIEVIFIITERETNFKPGMSVYLLFLRPGKSSYFFLPFQAFTHPDSLKPYSTTKVFVWKTGMALTREVKLGRIQEQVEIIAGITSEDSAILAKNLILSEKTPLKIKSISK